MSERTLRLVFAGTPEFAVPCFEACRISGAEVVAVYTQPDRPAGRGRKLTPSPVKQAALEVGVEILHPLFVFGDAGAFDFAEIYFAFVELRLEDGDVLLSELKFETRDFFGGVAFAKMARFLADGGADFLLFVGEIGFGDAQIDFSERDVGFCLRAEDWDLYVDASV